MRVHALAIAALAACGGDPSTQDGHAAVDSDAAGGLGWVRQIGGAGEEAPVAVAARAAGGGVVLVGLGPPGSPVPVWNRYGPSRPTSVGLMRLDAKGQRLWSFAQDTRGATLSRPSVALSPIGEVYLALHAQCPPTGCLDLGAGPLAGSALVKFAPDGRLLWMRRLTGTLASDVAIDGSGGTAVALRDAAGSERLERRRPDGSRIFSVPSPALRGPSTVGEHRTALAFDQQGNLAVGRGLEFFKLDPGGNRLWSANLAKSADATGFILDVGTTWLGTIVVTAGFEGTVSWAGTDAWTQFGTGGFVAVTEPNGAPRFGRAVPGADVGLIDAAVDPNGSVSVLVRYGFCGDTLQSWNLAGQYLGEQRIPESCGNTFGATAIEFDQVSRRALVAGWLGTGADFGAGPLTSRGGTDAWVADVLP